MSKTNWQTLRFDQIAHNIAERIEPTEADVDIYVGLEHLDPESLKIRRWGTPEDVKGTKLRFYKGDIIFGRRRAYQRKLAVAEFDGICSAHAMVLRANEENVLPEFLPFFMQSDTFFDRALQISVGSLSPTINWKTMARQEFTLPPKAEQRRIADILWAADEVIQKKTSVVEKLWVLRQSTIDHFFPEPSQSPTPDKRVVLQDIVQMQNGRAYPSKDYSEDGIRLLRPGNLGKDGYFDWAEDVTRYLPKEYIESASKYLILPGDVVINLTAQSLEDGFMGRVCMARDGEYCLLNQRIGRFVCDESILPEYLYRSLQTKRFRILVETWCEGSKIKHLYWQHLADFSIVLPPLKKQKQVIEKIRLIDENIARAQKNYEETVYLQYSLRENLLTGKEDTPDVQ